MGVDFKGLLLRGLYGRWHRPSPVVEGYAVLLPFPSDMPFLLKYALEGLKHLDLTHCRQILVVGDGEGVDGGSALRSLVDESDDPRVEFIEAGPVDRFVAKKLRGLGSSLHWLSIVRGTTRCRAEAVFLHDSDAFFLESGGIERQYREFRDRGMHTLGVTARIDPAFLGAGYSIPGTWEMMYSTRWARSHPPASHKGRLQRTPHGPILFDTMLMPQYLDYDSGRVGVMADPPAFVHFNGTIVTYRVYRERQASGSGRPVVDELFRILLIALLEDLLPPADGRRVVPTVPELAAGLVDPAARVTYGSRVAIQEYPIFRGMIDQLCESPVMQGERASRIRESIRPFDDHFEAHRADPAVGSLVQYRSDGLG
jgi:hypothetical protein